MTGARFCPSPRRSGDSWHGRVGHAAIGERVNRSFSNHKTAAYRAARSTVRIALEKPLPYGLIREMVRFRVLETKRQAKARTVRKRK